VGNTSELCDLFGSNDMITTHEDLAYGNSLDKVRSTSYIPYSDSTLAVIRGNLPLGCNLPTLSKVDNVMYRGDA